MKLEGFSLEKLTRTVLWQKKKTGPSMTIIKLCIKRYRTLELWNYKLKPLRPVRTS